MIKQILISLAALLLIGLVALAVNVSYKMGYRFGAEDTVRREVAPYRTAQDRIRHLKYERRMSEAYIKILEQELDRVRNNGTSPKQPAVFILPAHALTRALADYLWSGEKRSVEWSVGSNRYQARLQGPRAVVNNQTTYYGHMSTRLVIGRTRTDPEDPNLVRIDRWEVPVVTGRVVLAATLGDCPRYFGSGVQYDAPADCGRDGWCWDDPAVCRGQENYWQTEHNTAMRDAATALKLTVVEQ